jgi:CHAT domain-containing protein
LDTVNTAIAKGTQPARGAVRNGHEHTTLPAVAADTALISYWLGSESAYAWVVSSGEIHWVRLAAPRGIADQAATFHRSLTRLVDVPVERRLSDGFTLYTTIVRPLEPWLSDVRNWVIVPDGALDYVAFAALRIRDTDPASFVVMQHDVAVTPAAWMLHSNHGRQPEQGRGRVLLVADPVYQADDPRLASLRSASAGAQTPARRLPAPGDRQYSRLRFTGEEAAGIAAQFPQTQIDQLTGVDATRERLLSLDWSQYRFIHIATHGIVDAQVPELSSLILGSYDAHGEVPDRAVRVADLSLQTLKADVAVLSACETALGAEVRSEGLVGLSSTLLARGAHAVVASLWPVPDEVSARLMTEFYRHMLQGSVGPEAALGTAMRSIASREASADPALWGAFQVSVTAVGSPAESNAGTVEVATANVPAE